MSQKIHTLINHLRFIFSISATLISFLTLLRIFIFIVLFKSKTVKINHYYSIEIKTISEQKQRIYIRSIDYFILYEIFGLEVYKPFIEKISSDGSILDLGGHIGLATIYFRTYLKNPIVVFEPSVANLYLLKKNVANLNNILIETLAVSNFEGETIFHIYPDSPSRIIAAILLADS